tara:strand:+ start:10300 stop:10425 length:126 start_codon:yes stop_codon:yes gene_type:complete
MLSYSMMEKDDEMAMYGGSTECYPDEWMRHGGGWGIGKTGQ